MKVNVVLTDRYYDDDVFYIANINTYSIYLYHSVSIHRSLDVYAIACVFTYKIAYVFTYIKHHYLIIIISHVLLNADNYLTHTTLLTHFYYLPGICVYHLCIHTYVKALFLYSRFIMFLSHDDYVWTFLFVSGVGHNGCYLLYVTCYYKNHIYSDCNIFIDISWFVESIIISRNINMLYQTMVVNFLILLQALIACSRITISKPRYYLISILIISIIDMVPLFLSNNVLFIVCPARYAIYDMASRFISSLGNICVLIIIIVLLTLIVNICSVPHIHKYSPCTYTHQLVLYIVNCERLINDNLQFWRVTKLILSMLAGDIELNPGPTYINPQGTHSLQLCHLNIQSLRRNHEKHKHIGLQLAGKYDIITLSETWLAPDIPNDVYDITGYHPLFRRDRQTNTIGGGVAAWISMDLVAKRRLDLEVHSVEAMWLEVRNCNHTLLICTVYRPHTENITFWESMQFMLDNARHTGISNILFAGDLNADKLSRSSDVKRNGEMFDFFVSVNHLSSHINEPTRITPQTQSCLDRIVSNIPQYVVHTEVLSPLLTNDHCTIGITLRFAIHTNTSYSRTMWDYQRANYEGLISFLNNIDWNIVCNSFTDVDEAAESWANTLLDGVRSFIPHKVVTIRLRDKPWYTNSLRRCKRKLDRCHKRAKQRNNEHSWATFRSLRNSYIQLCRDAEKRYEKDQIDHLSQSTFTTKACWKLYRSVLGLSTDRHCPSLKHNDRVITDSKSKSNLFNQIFAEKSMIDDMGKSLPADLPFRTSTINPLNQIDITLREVNEQLSLLNVNKAFGPDGIGPKILKPLKEVIAPTLLKLFRATMRHKKVPKIWKQANVTPIYKKGDRSDPNNYRPISLLNTTSKLLEKIVFKHIFNHLRDNHIISQWQSGFMPGCSTITQLLEIYHKFCEAVDNGKEVRVIFLDISRAFDRVWHAGLLYKLRKYGIEGDLLEWIADYLRNRQQRVCLNGVVSDWCNILAGVPQGSILGPLLFLIFINDLTEVVRFTQMRLFADDTCLSIVVDNRDQCGDKINEDLHAIHEWSEQWLVTFSEAKTKSLLISNKHDKEQNPPLKMNNVILNEVQSHKHLGVTFNHNLSWTSHIDEVCLKAMKRLDIIQRFKFKLARKDLERFYISFVLPIIEYGDALWDGANHLDTGKLDKVQIRAMRIITGATERSHIQGLYDDLGWHTLSQRRTIHKLKWFFKIKNHMVPGYLSELVPPTTEQRHNYVLRRRDNVTPFRTHRQYFSSSFYPSVVQEWNQLPSAIQHSHSLDTFCRALKGHIKRTLKTPWYGQGDRFLDIQHTRIRLGCSKLKSHLHYNLFVEDNPHCMCGHINEDPQHYFFHCRMFNRQRTILLTEIRKITQPTLTLLLHGDANMSLEENICVVLHVQTYLKDTHRFQRDVH